MRRIILVCFILVSALMSAKAAVNYYVVNVNTDAGLGVTASTPATFPALPIPGAATVFTGDLRSCINAANANAGSFIYFNVATITGSVITLNSDLPPITAQMTIDATANTAYANAPLVGINRGGQTNGTSIFTISTASAVTIKGLAIYNGKAGIEFTTGNTGSVIQGNYIGLNLNGTITGAGIYDNGIWFNSTGYTNITIGGTTATQRNVISGCAQDITGSGPTSTSVAGIYVQGATNNVLIQGNYIGTDPTGTIAVSNGNATTPYPGYSQGIFITNSSGSTGVNPVVVNQNVISGNIGMAIWAKGCNSSYLIFSSNKIGTDVTGNNKLANTAGGIYIQGGNGYNVIENNTISGNGGATHGANAPAPYTEWDVNNQVGIFLQSVSYTSIKGNYIGATGATGTDTLGNRGSGIKIEATGATGGTCPSTSNPSQYDTVGGATIADRNVICGNGYNSIQVSHGILLKDPGTKNCIVQNNYVGIGADGLTPLGNRQDGISFLGANNITVEGNVCSANEGGGGIFLQSDFATPPNQASNNTIIGNYIGTTASGLSGGGALANGGGGIVVQHGSSNNYIGVTSTGTVDPNIIGGNSVGILVQNGGEGGPPLNNTIAGNYIGVGEDGTTSIPNTSYGIEFNQVSVASLTNTNLIGKSGAPNIIANNGSGGILIDSSAYTTISYDSIGMNKTGAATGNGTGDGITISNSSKNNIISNNSIGNNKGNGIQIAALNATTSTNNAIDHNHIYNNTARGIALNGGNGGIGYAKPNPGSTPIKFSYGAAGQWVEIYGLDGVHSCPATGTSNQLQGLNLVTEGAGPLTFTPPVGQTIRDYAVTISTAASATTFPHSTSEFSECACVDTVLLTYSGASSVCQGTTITLNAQATITTAPVTFSWSDNGTAISGGTATGPTGSNNVYTATYTYTVPATAPTGTNNFTVSILDAAGCANTSKAQAITVNAQPNPPTVTSTVTYCQNATASALTATGTGLLWYTAATGGTGSTTAPTPSTTTVGTTSYYVSQTVSGCESNRASIAVTINANPTATVSTQTNVSCTGGSTGSVTVTGASGTPAYTYSDNGTSFQASNVFSTLAANTYTLTIKDANGCTGTTTATITQPTAAVAASVSASTNVNCFGGTTGSITVTGSGGTSPYTYSDNGTSFQASNVFSTLAAGSYTLTVKDANGCTATATKTLTQPSATVAASVSGSTNVSCFGGTTGSITVTGSGGTSPYTCLLYTSPSPRD